MNWAVEIADAAYEDMRNIFFYIANELQSPDDARNVIRRILAEIATLSQMPNRFRSYPREPLSSKGVRVMDVGNYCVYYIAREAGANPHSTSLHFYTANHTTPPITMRSE